MLYLCIGLVIIIIILVIRMLLLYSALSNASEQMDEIEQQPEKNRQLKMITVNHRLEALLKRINVIYQQRQQERILYQRRETQIRSEIENISHDLRTPLTSMIGYMELIQDEATSKEDREEFLRILSKRARVLQGFIQDFYEISRIEGEDYPLLLELVPIQNMVSEAAIAYYREFTQREVTVEINLEKKPSNIIADRIQLNRILNNLIQNALKYAKHQFVISQYTVNEKCVLAFKNDRNHMSEEELNRIFDRFYTGDRSRSEGSSGLGLTITKLLVEKMKGTIEARLEKDMFVIELQWPLYSSKA